MPFRISIILLFFLIGAEIFCLKQWLKPEGNELVSIIYLISGMLISIIPLFRIQNLALYSYPGLRYLAHVVFVLLLVYAGFHAYETIQGLAIDYRMADMLPVIEVMNERYLSGEEIYVPIPQIHGGMVPIYLPAMWLPYLFATALDFDMRYVAVAFILIGLIIIYTSRQSKHDRWPIFLWLVLLYLILKMTFIKENRIISMTEEGVVVAYYLFLGWALWKEKWWWIALAISLCLLSRYALLFWVPVYLIHLLLIKKKKLAINIAIATPLIVLSILLLSRSADKLLYFAQLPANYKAAIADPGLQWKYNPLIEESLGLAKFIPYESLPSMHNWILIISFLAPIAFLVVAHKFKKGLNFQLFGICCLKFSLVWFYNLLTMPYIYLFFTSTFFSLAIFYYYIQQQRDHPLAFVPE